MYRYQGIKNISITGKQSEMFEYSKQTNGYGYQFSGTPLDLQG